MDKNINIPQISIIVPLYNEEDVFPILIERLNSIIKKSGFSIEVILVDDGSKDSTPIQMTNLGLNDANYTCIILSRNFGHQTALTAGLHNANGKEGIMIIDGDLQDPPELLTEFYDLYHQGYDIVYGVRKNRKENIWKKMSYSLFYRILKNIANIDMPLDSGDFCFLSRKVVDCINLMPEESRFLRGMRTWVGFKQHSLIYERETRAGGDPKYTFNKLLSLALNGIFNFSEFPVRFITFLGMSAISVSVIYFLYVIFRKFMYNDVPIGFTALIFTIILFSGVQLLSISILGQYIIRIFFQVKNRPLYIIKNKIANKTIEQ
jgi:polyisoprenyl-phosphate glycosyltransferase